MKINVTKTFLPEFSGYVDLLKQVWERGWVTNNGQFVQELESKLKAFLGVKHLFLVSNGTVGLEIAIKALDIKDNVITTPFSYVATTSSLFWLNCRPIFADINANTFCIDTKKIAERLCEKTRTILATHVFGNPCDVEAIREIAKKNKLKVIYDAAHAFGVRHQDSSILIHGDISVLSFHATKIFHTIEGGALITSDDEIAHKISYMRNFGHRGEEDFWGCGINGKNSEFHAAMGLCILPRMTELIDDRKEKYGMYRNELQGAPLQWQKIKEDTEYNYSYCPIVFHDEASLLRVKNKLNREDIYPRRYFYPALNKLNFLEKQPAPVAESIAERILCLPLYYGLQKKEIERICKIIKSEL